MLAQLEDPDPEPGVAGAGSVLVSVMRIQLENPNRYPEAKATGIRPWLERLVAGLVADPAATLAVRFVSDREIRRLNREFRHRDAPTDVLSFPGGETPDGHHLGDLAVSVPRARAQAQRAGHAVARELEVLILHGLLHCLGHDHETDGGEMEATERRMRREWVRPG